MKPVQVNMEQMQELPITVAIGTRSHDLPNSRNNGNSTDNTSETEDAIYEEISCYTPRTERRAPLPPPRPSILSSTSYGNENIPTIPRLALPRKRFISKRKRCTILSAAFVLMAAVFLFSYVLKNFSTVPLKDQKKIQENRTLLATLVTSATVRFAKQDCRQRMDVHGWKYKGFISVTKSGVTCSYWDDLPVETPETFEPAMFADNRSDHNYCRNPKHWERSPWCYTTRGDRRWEYCDIPQCANGTDQDDCLGTNDLYGRQYTGSFNQTKYGETCQRWDEQSPHVHHYRDLEYFPDKDLHHNYCRNPLSWREAPWCHTRDGPSWDFCEISLCHSY